MISIHIIKSSSSQPVAGFIDPTQIRQILPDFADGSEITFASGATINVTEPVDWLLKQVGGDGDALEYQRALEFLVDKKGINYKLVKSVTDLIRALDRNSRRTDAEKKYDEVCALLGYTHYRYIKDAPTLTMKMQVEDLKHRLDLEHENSVTLREVINERVALIAQMEEEIAELKASKDSLAGK